MSFVNVLPLEVVEQIFDYSLPRKNHAQLHGLSAQIDAHLPVIHEAPLSLSSVSKVRCCDQNFQYYFSDTS